MKWLLCLALFLLGCQRVVVTQADYSRQVRVALTSTDGWLKTPKDAKLLDQSIKDCQTVMEAYLESDFDQRQSIKDLKLLKLALLLCKAAMAQGVAAEVAPEGLTSQSPADSVRQAREMVEADLQKEEKPATSSSPTA